MKQIALIMPFLFCSLSFAQNSSSADGFKLEDVNCNCRSDQKKDLVDISEVIEKQVQEESKEDPNAKFLPPDVAAKKYKEDMKLEQGILPGVKGELKPSKKKLIELKYVPGGK